MSIQNPKSKIQNRLGVYLHIPFCRTRCPYCDFVSQAVPEAPPEAFVAAVCNEIAAFEGPREAGTVFFGGGTPSLLEARQLERILDALHARFDLEGAEKTIEANPDDVTAPLAQAWRALGIDRVSLGVQSFDDGALRYLGRRHDADTARRACACIAERFDNWSMDLIFGAMPVHAWDATLIEAQDYQPTHISTYGLTYESGTPFGDRAGEAVDEATWLALYRRADALLEGFTRYEISNFARPSYTCRHNLIYWHNEAYAGLGPAAYSFLDGVRARNHAALEAYLRDPGGKMEALRLSPREIRVETVIQHLRLRDGIRHSAYARRFGTALLSDFGTDLATLAARGLIEDDGLAIRPTALGFEMNNEIGLQLVD